MFSSTPWPKTPPRKPLTPTWHASGRMALAGPREDRRPCRRISRRLIRYTLRAQKTRLLLSPSPPPPAGVQASGLEPVSADIRTSLCSRERFPPGKGLTRPETARAFSATMADSGRQRPRHLASPTAKPRIVKDYSDRARKPGLRRTAWWSREDSNCVPGTQFHRTGVSYDNVPVPRRSMGRENRSPGCITSYPSAV
jgi:hypothetical protein